MELPRGAQTLSDFAAKLLVALYVFLVCVFLVLDRAAEPLSFDTEVDLRLAGLGLSVMSFIDAAYSAVGSPVLLFRTLSPGLRVLWLRQGRTQLELLLGLLSLAATSLCFCGHMEFLRENSSGTGSLWFTWHVFLRSTWISLAFRLSHQLFLSCNRVLKEGLTSLHLAPLAVPIQLLYQSATGQLPITSGDVPYALQVVLRRHIQSEVGQSGPAATVLADGESLQRLLMRVQSLPGKQGWESPKFCISAAMHNTALGFSELSLVQKAEQLLCGLPSVRASLYSALCLAAECPSSLLPVVCSSVLSTLLSCSLCVGVGQTVTHLSTATPQWTVEEYVSPVVILCALGMLLGLTNWVLERSVHGLAGHLDLRSETATFYGSISNISAERVGSSVHTVVLRPVVVLCTSAAVLLAGSWQGCLIFALCVFTDTTLSTCQCFVTGNGFTVSHGIPTAFSAGLAATASLAVASIGFMRVLEGGDPASLAGEGAASLLLVYQMFCSNAQFSCSLAELHWGMWLQSTGTSSESWGASWQDKHTLDPTDLTKKLLATIDDSIIGVI